MMTRSVLWDSSAILALVDRSDRNHLAAVLTAKKALKKTVPFITNYVQVEAHALLLTRVGRFIARQWLMQSGLEIIHVTPDEEKLACQLIIEHADKDWSLCDAMSFVVIERRGAKGAFSFDKHFKERGRFRVFGF